MKRHLAAPLLLAMLAGPAIAQGPFAGLGAARDWTGASLGVGIGRADLDVDGIVDGSETGSIGGLRFNVDRDFGGYVLGGGIDYDFSELDAVDATLEDLLRVKLRGGIDAGPGLVYATGGYARGGFASEVDGENDFSLDGYFLGIGAEFPLAGGVTVGAELLHHRFSEIRVQGVEVRDADADVGVAQVSLNYRF